MLFLKFVNFFLFREVIGAGENNQICMQELLSKDVRKIKVEADTPHILQGVTPQKVVIEVQRCR